jgi:uncharacterized protein YgiM (DUF1202 family)
MDQPIVLIIFLVLFLILWIITVVTFIFSAAKPIWLIGFAVFLMGLMGMSFAPTQVKRSQRQIYSISVLLILAGLVVVFFSVPDSNPANSLGPPPTRTHTVVPSVTATPGPYIPPTPTKTRTPTPLPKVVVSKLSVNVRSGPGLDFPVIEVLSQGNELGVASRTADNKWVQVTTPQGNKGWIAVSLLSMETIDLNTIPVSSTAQPGQ